jgi:hypothetical protein
MTGTPLEAGRRVATLFARSAPRLFADLAESGLVPPDAAGRAAARAEWECYALFGVVRGIVAGSGFAPRTAETIDALHAAVFGDWDPAAHGGDTEAARRALLSKRYEEYETIGQAGGAAGARDAALRLGAAAAAHVCGAGAPDGSAELLGSMHETLAEAVVSLLSGAGELPRDDESLRASATRHGQEHPQGVATPPLDGAWRIVERLESAGIECALGGSGLLAALGLADTVRDWDLTTDAPRPAVEAALAGLEWEHKGSDALHADEKFMFAALDVEIIRGFAFFTPGGIVRVPTIVTRRWAGLPVGSPECWAAAYDLLERHAKRDALLEWLSRHGANRVALDALLAQPLPAPLAASLRSLPIAAA